MLAGPSDPALTLLAVQSLDGKPLAVLANYSMHYFGAAPVSADYYGLFAEKLGPLIGAPDTFVGIMSQGTSGDQHWMDYSQPKRDVTLDGYASQMAQIAAEELGLPMAAVRMVQNADGGIDAPQGSRVTVTVRLSAPVVNVRHVGEAASARGRSKPRKN